MHSMRCMVMNRGLSESFPEDCLLPGESQKSIGFPISSSQGLLSSFPSISTLLHGHGNLPMRSFSRKKKLACFRDLGILTGFAVEKHGFS